MRNRDIQSNLPYVAPTDDDADRELASEENPINPHNNLFQTDPNEELSEEVILNNEGIMVLDAHFMSSFDSSQSHQPPSLLFISDHPHPLRMKNQTPMSSFKKMMLQMTTVLPSTQHLTKPSLNTQTLTPDPPLVTTSIHLLFSKSRRMCPTP